MKKHWRRTFEASFSNTYKISQGLCEVKDILSVFTTHLTDRNNFFILLVDALMTIMHSFVLCLILLSVIVEHC